MKDCLNDMTMALISRVEKCTLHQAYHDCMLAALRPASTLCDEFTAVTNRQNTYNLIDAVNKDEPNPCSIAIAEEFQLDACSKQVATCGKYAQRASIAFTETRYETSCTLLDSFKTCMDYNTAACWDRNKIQRFVDTEFTSLRCKNSCDVNSSRVREYPSVTMCERTREPCRIVEQFSTAWPTFLRCSVPALLQTELRLPGRWDPDKFSLADILANNYLTLSKLIEEPETQVCGIKLIMDLTDVGWNQAKNISPFFAKKIASLIQEAFPARFKGLIT
ncbi:hypothetical protein BaRGS_00019772 [Batillaria attramentaria]|uniref:CRAL-TRIO domain-containing protein n=1 Tax=Batillaria attramentaria TaxID=370345 RepID=A0ABD0KPV2_9CAEN